MAKKIVGTVEATDYEAVLFRSDGSRVAAEITSVALTDDQHVVGIFGIFRPERPILRLLAAGYSTAQMAEPAQALARDRPQPRSRADAAARGALASRRGRRRSRARARLTAAAPSGSGVAGACVGTLDVWERFSSQTTAI